MTGGSGGEPGPAVGAGGADLLQARGDELLTARVGTLLSRGPVTIPVDSSIHAAARLMREQEVSCLLVTAAGGLVGILTDRDLRNRVVAEGLPPESPIGTVLSPEPWRIGADDHVVDALFVMLRHGIHHLPVMDGDAVVGCLTATTLIERLSRSPLFLARTIHECQTPEQLREALERLPHLIAQMVEAGHAARSVGHIVSGVTDAVTIRLLELAEAALGPRPVPYLWLAAGSQARREQAARTDQDNAMILDDAYEEHEHGAWFRALSRFVCDGLHLCGYVYCPGETMAMTDRWRQRLAVWRRYFGQWIDEPEPMALMLSSIFFDLRPVRGERALFDELHGLVLERSRRNRIFQTHLATNALKSRPPIGFFRNFVLVRGGEHARTLDLKHGGLMPIVDLARLHALAAGVPAVNTLERLRAVGAAGVLSPEGAAELAEAWEFISLVRLRHQAEMIRNGRPPGNHIAPRDLSGRERGRLKSAFRAVKTMQQVTAARYQVGHF
ncbi:MAG TPA: putative nucleotidyltransferase substrate binding domain-containing protein [Geminicoccaceae bacterium]|nr:putative nucleotidyltransferase substrate binding domain-containing protein [Geminicoccaceae bacterium]